MVATMLGSNFLSFIVTLSVVLASGWSVLLWHSAAEPPIIPTTLTTQLYPATSTPGEAIRLVELIPNHHPVVVCDVYHRVLKIASYDRRATTLRNLKPPLFVPQSADHDFDDLPGNLTGAHGIAFNTRSPREKGMEFEFRAKYFGSYLIYTAWEFKNGVPPLESQPVVLTIRPPTDLHGRAIIKPNWISKDD